MQTKLTKQELLSITPMVIDDVRLLTKVAKLESTVLPEDVKNERIRVFTVNDNPYIVLESGRIFSRRGELKHSGMGVGNKYKSVTVGGVNIYVHRLVFKMFNTDIDIDGMDIDHLDNDPSNNRLSNLECITHSENLRRRDELGNKRRAVIQYDLDYNVLATYPSIKEASKVTGIDMGSISHCISGRHKQLRGKWIFKHDTHVVIERDLRIASATKERLIRNNKYKGEQ